MFYQCNGKHAITYNVGAGRFGDKLLGFAHALYISHTTSLPLLFRDFNFHGQFDFPINQQLTFDNKFLHYDAVRSHYQNEYHVNSPQSLTEFLGQIRDTNTPSTIYIIDYLPSFISEWDQNNTFALLYEIPWRDASFHRLFQESVKPNIEIPDFTKKGKLNVAVHVRTHSGDDDPKVVYPGFPLKNTFGLDYYKRQIRKVYDWNQRLPMYVFIFSDTDNPRKVINEFKEEFKGLDIEFNIQELVRPDLNNTIQDFFAMQKFNVIIAIQSNFATMAYKLGDVDMLIMPLRVQGSYPNFRFDRIQVINKKSSWFPFDLNLICKD